MGHMGTVTVSLTYLTNPSQCRILHNKLPSPWLHAKERPIPCPLTNAAAYSGSLFADLLGEAVQVVDLVFSGTTPTAILTQFLASAYPVLPNAIVSCMPGVVP